MAQVILGRSDSVNLANGVFEIYGTVSGVETITVGPGTTAVFDASFNTGGDVIRLRGAAGSYTIVRDGSVVVLTSGTGADRISVTIPVGVVGATIQFDDRSDRLVFNTTTNNVELGTRAQIVGGINTVPVTPVVVIAVAPITPPPVTPPVVPPVVVTNTINLTAPAADVSVTTVMTKVRLGPMCTGDTKGQTRPIDDRTGI